MNHQRVVKAVVLPLPIDESSSSSRTSHYPLPADYVAELDRRHAALEFHEEVLDDRPLSPNSTEARKSRIEALRIAVIEAVALAKHNTSDGNWAFVTELLRTNAGKSKRGLWMDIGQEYIPTDVTTPTPTPGLTKQTLVMAQKMDILTKVSNWREGVEPLVEEEPVKQRKFKQAVNTKEKEKEREVRKKTAERRLDPSPLGFSVTRPRKAAEGKGKARQVDLEDILEVAGTSPTKPSSYSSSPKELKRIEDLSDAFLPPSFPAHVQTSTPKPNAKALVRAPAIPVNSSPLPLILGRWEEEEEEEEEPPSKTSARPLGKLSTPTVTYGGHKRRRSTPSSAIPSEARNSNPDRPSKRAHLDTLPPTSSSMSVGPADVDVSMHSASTPKSFNPKSLSPVPAPVAISILEDVSIPAAKILATPHRPTLHDKKLPTLTELLASDKKMKSERMAMRTPSRPLKRLENNVLVPGTGSTTDDSGVSPNKVDGTSLREELDETPTKNKGKGKATDTTVAPVIALPERGRTVSRSKSKSAEPSAQAKTKEKEKPKSPSPMIEPCEQKEKIKSPSLASRAVSPAGTSSPRNNNNVFPTPSRQLAEEILNIDMGSNLDVDMYDNDVVSPAKSLSSIHDSDSDSDEDFGGIGDGGIRNGGDGDITMSVAENTFFGDDLDVDFNNLEAPLFTSTQANLGPSCAQPRPASPVKAPELGSSQPHFGMDESQDQSQSQSQSQFGYNSQMQGQVDAKINRMAKFLGQDVTEDVPDYYSWINDPVMPGEGSVYYEEKNLKF